MWTVKSLIEKFTSILIRDIQRIQNGSLTFSVHFRNGKPQKIEVESHEHFGGSE